MAERPVPDARERARALDPEQSFIVQAPAGSGKTGLLIQRVLVLLARVDAPEELVAITFTRKAAAEMRERVLRALAAADAGTPPGNDHERTTAALAREVLARDAQLGWRLRDSPQRLRIQTIDAFCAGLGRQLPFVSGLGGPPQLTEEAEPLYREAARAALATLEEGGDDAAAVADAVAHLDANLEAIETLVVALLGKRDQWLRHLHDDDAPGARRARLEATVRAEVAARLAALRSAFGGEELTRACVLAGAACAELDALGEDAGDLAAFRDAPAPPGADAADLPKWRALDSLLLTASRPDWRRQPMAKQGFPAPSAAKGEEKERRKAHKARMTALLEQLQERPELAAQLRAAAALPAARYADGQWAALGAIARLLLLAAAHLKLVFARRGRVDFLEVGRRAVDALVDDDAPTDLALALDYRIRHLLVDEFQDTSYLQRELLARLTEGWVPGDGRTLFLVGDPMQSIYRFREAEVALFLDAARGRLGGVALEALRLRANFRSRDGLVAWFNDAFPGVLAPVDDPGSGAVAYVPAAAMRDADGGPAVAFHPLFGRDDEAEAESVVRLVGEARAAHPGGRVAVLVRARTHLAALLPKLRAAGLRYRAVDVEPLATQPAVELLWALVRALLHRGDRVAWLALLRGPVCGLQLADLLALVGDDRATPVPALLADPARTARLTVDGRARAERVWAVLDEALGAVGRHDLRRLVEGAWLTLGGPAVAGGAVGLQAADAFLDLLETHAEGGTLPDPDTFVDALGRLHAPPDPLADETLQLMTVHKAKGLEFDTVILPGLGRRPGGDRKPLLAWMELPGDGLLMAPIDARGGERDPLYAWIRSLERQRVDQETGRLLYVAATRARERLHLVGAVDLQEKDGALAPRPPAGTFIERLWEAFEPHCMARLDADVADAAPVASTDAAPRTALVRLPVAWRAPTLPEPVMPSMQAAPPEPGEAVIFDWAGEGARAAGTVVHRLLEAWGRDGLPPVGELSAPASAFVRSALREQGLSGAPLEEAQARVTRALHATLADPRGRWLFDPAHGEARSELALTALLDERRVALVIDRTFVDTDGTRWIVDFKTSEHGGGGLDAFLDREQARYREQLERYARVLRLLESRPQRLALYFPLVSGWREWAPDG